MLDAGMPNLLDNARAQPLRLTGELERQREIATDLEQPLTARLEAFEDLFDSEVGDTSFVRARNVERETGLRQLFLKFEGGNPSGTQKDRIAFSQAQDALRRGFDTVAVATCGNYGAALALAASLAGLKCRIYIPARYHSGRFDEIIEQGAEIVRTEGDYEAAVEFSGLEAGRLELYDANPGGENTLLQLNAYAEIAYEIYDELRDAPAIVAVPVSNGTTLAGIHRGFARLYRRGKTSRMPRFVGGSAPRKNPVIEAFRKNLPTCEDLQPQQIRETAVNEPLINWHSFDGEEALTAIRTTSGWAVSSSDREMLNRARKLREIEGMTVLPASTAGLNALLQGHETEPLQPDRYVAILTGKRW